ncbi:MAG: serine O-acetyltransferase [Acidobacteriota bacterium]
MSAPGDAPPPTPAGVQPDRDDASVPYAGLRATLAADTRRLTLIKHKRFPWYVIESLLFENGFQAVVLHRLAHACKRRGVPVLGPLIARFNLFLTGCDIAPAAEIGGGLMISHGSGLVIGNRVRIGRDALLLHQVTLGAPSARGLARMPRVGDRVHVGAGSKLIGGIVVGDDVFIGADVLLTHDVPDDAKVVRADAPRIVSDPPERGKNA